MGDRAASSSRVATAASWVSLVGMVLLAHFGGSSHHCCGEGGVDAVPIMDEPLLSASLSEFWGGGGILASGNLVTNGYFGRCIARSEWRARGSWCLFFLD